MESAENTILKLNELLVAEQFNREEFESILRSFEEQFKPNILILDFEYYNEDRLESARSNKMTKLKLQDFEATAKFRKMEKECMIYIEIKTEFKIKKSTFFYVNDYLFYSYLGTAKNDKTVRVLISSTIDKRLNE